MTNDTLTYSFKVTGLERKQVASVIADTIGEQVKYAGAPSFNYNAGGWTIDRNGIVTTPELGIKEEHVTLRMVLDALHIAGATAERDLTVTLPMNWHNGNSLRNLVNMIWTKQGLIRKALGWQEVIIPDGLVEAINAVPIDTSEDFAEVVNQAIEAGKITGDNELDIDMAEKTLQFSFFNASLDAQEIHAFGMFCWQLNNQAQKQKFTSVKQKETENDKYAFRCFLLKLGFIGKEYKIERSILLSKLEGNTAFRTTESQQAAEAKRNGHRTEALTEGSANE
ncbi:virulence-related protein [Desulfosporosinus sp. I2]|uniref:hypothetical protein n=1 Tax=Desulfosporosinus sp. I2 TaxID=1617025 RepID=UPI00061E4386|nr:hypothetical protein [Desulfosporosinus sp. I2]KJR48417.1 virulence-related protein [Desulfosporosinus sp. I2]